MIILLLDLNQDQAADPNWGENADIWYPWSVALCEAERSIFGGLTMTKKWSPSRIHGLDEGNPERLEDYRTYRYMCGGTIIASHWIFTALHCIMPLWSPHYRSE